MLVVVTIFSKFGSAGDPSDFTVSFLQSLIVAGDGTFLVGLALDISSLAIGFGDDFDDFDFGGFNFRFFGFLSATRLSQGSKDIETVYYHCTTHTHIRLINILLKSNPFSTLNVF